MRTRSKLLLAAISAPALLGLAIGTASARNLEISNSANGFRITWNPLRIEFSGREARCPVTFEGTFERSSIVKSPSSRVGRVIGAAVGTCTRNTATFLRETLPWELDYNSFTGTLPSIASVSLNLIRASFSANLEGIECLAQSRSDQPWSGIITAEANGTFTGFRTDESRSIETSGGFFCITSRARASGDASTITSRGGTTAITVRLI